MICPSCQKEAKSIKGSCVDKKMFWKCNLCSDVYKPLPHIKNCDNFNPHYDSQIGEFFESREHKDNVLKQKGLFQVSGKDSPRQTEGLGRIKCTRDQFERQKDKL